MGRVRNFVSSTAVAHGLDLDSIIFPVEGEWNKRILTQLLSICGGGGETVGSDNKGDIAYMKYSLLGGVSPTSVLSEAKEVEEGEEVDIGDGVLSGSARGIKGSEVEEEGE